MNSFHYRGRIGITVGALRLKPSAKAEREKLRGFQVIQKQTEPAIDQMLRERARVAADIEAVVFPDGRLTYSELDAEVDRFARSLSGLGVRPGENIAIMLPNDVDFVVSVLATLRVGARAVPVNLRFKETELGHFLTDSDAVVIITTGQGINGPAAGALLPALLPGILDGKPGALDLPEAPRLRRVIWLDGEAPSGSDTRESLRLFDADLQEGGVDPDEAAMIMYTSGTTAKPKGALISHRALAAQAVCVGKDAYRLQAGDRIWTPLPMFHTGGLMSLFGSLATGATFVHAGFFEPAKAIKQLEQERVAVAMPVFEPLWLPILDHPDFAQADLSTLRIVGTVGVPASVRAMQARFTHATNVQASGMTEVTSYFAFGRPEDSEEVRATTTGYALDTVEVRIVDPTTGQDAAAGARGEVLLRGVGCFSGYYNDPVATAAAFDSDGWFHTGDLGVLDSDSRYTFVGRIKDMLKVGGENVAASEIEDFLSSHPAVGLVQVVSAPDARYTEVPAAFVQLASGVAVNESDLEEQLITFCMGKIATFKIPRYVRIISEWPMSGTKIQKYRLREMIAEELTKAGISEAPRLRPAERSALP